jgi:tetratricopeptide (TPR) repeat protein
LEKAESCLEDAPKTPKTSLALAETKLKQLKVEEAAAELLKLKENIEQLAPEDKSLTCNLLGNCLVHQNRLDEAERQFQEALDLGDSGERSHLGLASVSLLRQKYDHAEQHFQQVLERNPDHPKAHFGMGMVLWNRGDKEGSLKEYQAALDKDICHAQAMYGLTAAATEMERWDVAAEYLERYVAKKPSRTDFLFSLCSIYYRMGHKTKAEEVCNRILQQSPDHIEAKELHQKIQQESDR